MPSAMVRRTQIIALKEAVLRFLVEEQWQSLKWSLL